MVSRLLAAGELEERPCAEVRELGFMSTTLAATHYSPSAVHTLLEVSMRGEMTAAQLVTLLGLEKSSVSR
ncbi:hypothetical protein CKQ90_29775, partial [Klebsiella pneumoniae]